jgi:hypothetical protein
MNRILFATFLLALCSAASAANLVDIATDTTDPFNRADSEPSIAVDPSNPRNISVVAFSGRWRVNLVNAPVWQSTDGGSTWKFQAIVPPPPSSDFSGGPGDQKIAYDASGNLFVAVLAQSDAGGNLDWIYRTPDPGSPPCLMIPGSPPCLTPGAAYGDDQEQLEVDQVPGSPCSGRLYSPWLDTKANPQRSHVAWSIDQGQNMNDVAVGATTFNNRTTRIALARDGKVYVVYKLQQGTIPGTAPGQQNAAFVVQRSDDCGQTWNALGSSPVKVHPQDTVQTFFADPATHNGWGARDNVARATSSDAWIAIDPSSGDVYVAHVSVDASNFGQIYVARSTDNGQHWSETRVTDGTAHSAYPEIAVADNGTIGVLYIDFFVPPGPSNAWFRHRFTRSFDKGGYWTDQILQTMDPATLYVGTGDSKALWTDHFLWGDYEGLTAVGDTFYGVFTGQSIGRSPYQPDPIFFTETAMPPPPTYLGVTKVVVPGNDPGRFDLWVDGTVQLAGAQNNNGTVVLVEPGTHTVSETPSAGTTGSEYSTQFKGACAPNGTVTLAAGDSKTCRVVNFHGSGAFLTVEKFLDPANDSGRFDISVDGTLLLPSAGNGDTTGAIPLPPGTHFVDEEADSNTDGSLYRTSFGGACAPNGTVTLAAGDSKTCTISNRTCQPRTCPSGFHWCGCDEGCQRSCF